MGKPVKFKADSIGKSEAQLFELDVAWEKFRQVAEDLGFSGSIYVCVERTESHGNVVWRMHRKDNVKVEDLKVAIWTVLENIDDVDETGMEVVV